MQASTGYLVSNITFKKQKNNRLAQQTPCSIKKVKCKFLGISL